jgi:hypothetical protein
MSEGLGFEAQGPVPMASGGSYSGGSPPPSNPPPSGYTPPQGLGGTWSPQAAPVRLPPFPRWLDVGVIVIGIGALLTLIGFLCGAAATGQLAPGGSASAYRAWLAAFFVLAGLGIFLTVGGWLYRTTMAARQTRL